MFNRLRSTWLAGSGALFLALSLSGAVAAAALVTAVTAPTETVEPVDPVAAPDTTLTFEDLDGDGVDDDCDEEVVEDAPAATAAEEAVDLNGDGVISTSEAVQSNRIGGKNCNHGGYVSTVAHGDDCEAEEPVEETDGTTPTEADATCEEPVEETDEDAAEETPEECTPVEEEPAEEVPAEEEPVDTAPNAHGKAVSEVARDKTAIGGKNCNHGGAVSEAAKKDKADKDAAKQAREDAKAQRRAERGAKVHGNKHNN